MYVPLRRAFVKPISSFYTSKAITDQSSTQETADLTLGNMIKEISRNSVDILDELRPRNVSADSVKDYIKGEDYRSREQHYFDYVRAKKAIMEEIGKILII